MPPKKGGLKEPDVVVPDGDAGAGRDVFDQVVYYINCK